MLLDFLVLQNLSRSAVVVWLGSMGEPYFPKQLNLELQSLWNLSMPTIDVDEDFEEQVESIWSLSKIQDSSKE